MCTLECHRWWSRGGGRKNYWHKNILSIQSWKPLKLYTHSKLAQLAQLAAACNPDSFQSACAFVSELTNHRMHRCTRLRVRCSNASRLLNFTDLSTWFQMPPDSSRFNLKACKFKPFPGGTCPQTSLVGHILHVCLTSPNVHLLCQPWM